MKSEKGRIEIRKYQDSYFISVNYDEFGNEEITQELDVIEQLRYEEYPNTCSDLALDSIEDINSQLYKAGANELTEEEKEFIIEEIEISFNAYEMAV